MNKLLRYAEAKALLLSKGYRETEARRLLARDNPQRIPPHPHRLHSQARWHQQTVLQFLQTI